MPTSRCPIARPKKPPYQHELTDYHDWTDGTGCCRFCGQARKVTQVDVVLGHRIYEPCDAEEFPPPMPLAWPSVMRELARLES